MELETRIVKYRDTIAEKIKEAIPEIRDTGPHAGAFNIEAVKRFSMITPSARVVFLNMRKIKRNNVGHLIGPATMVVFLVTKDPFINRGFAPALDLAERVADEIELNTWGLDYCAGAQVREIEPYYSAEIDKIGVAVTCVTFSQEIQIGRSRHDEDERKEHLYGFAPNVPKEFHARNQGEDWEDIFG